MNAHKKILIASRGSLRMTHCLHLITMRTKLMSLFCLIFILGLLALWEASAASAASILPENKVPGWVESTARRLANGLKQ